MLVFKNGEITHEDIMGIFQSNCPPSRTINWEGHVLESRLWILEIPHFNVKPYAEVRLFESSDSTNGIYDIPKKEDESAPLYDLFWKTHATVVFKNLQEAITSIKKYKGFREDEVKELLEEAMKAYHHEQALYDFFKFVDDRQVDDDFYGDLKNFMEDRPEEWNVLRSTMKVFLYDEFLYNQQNTPFE